MPLKVGIIAIYTACALLQALSIIGAQAAAVVVQRGDARVLDTDADLQRADLRGLALQQLGGVHRLGRLAHGAGAPGHGLRGGLRALPVEPLAGDPHGADITDGPPGRRTGPRRRCTPSPPRTAAAAVTPRLRRQLSRRRGRVRMRRGGGVRWRDGGDAGPDRPSRSAQDATDGRAGRSRPTQRLTVVWATPSGGQTFASATARCIPAVSCLDLCVICTSAAAFVHSRRGATNKVGRGINTHAAARRFQSPDLLLKRAHPDR